MTSTVSLYLLGGKDGREARVQTACEPINEWLCITPYVAAYEEDGDLVLSGRFAVTHIPSGMTASRGSGCIECARYVGRALAELDWPNAPAEVNSAAYTAWLDGHAPELVDRVRTVLDLSWLCDAEDCAPRVLQGSAS